ncbi:MAG: hypothetical protein KAV87_12895 [Desulfobacteraceae bacterium]|nr:hypothetical protein [Desulfobacteraceae bacterium]
MDKQKVKKKANGNEAINFYHDLFLEKFGEKPYINGGKDGRIFKNIVSQCGIEKTKELLEEFFNSDDGFIQESGYTAGVFQTQINKLLIGASGNKPVPAVKTAGSKKRDQIMRLMKSEPKDMLLEG